MVNLAIVERTLILRLMEVGLRENEYDITMLNFFPPSVAFPEVETR